MPFCTGAILPTPQQVTYKDEFYPFDHAATIVGDDAQPADASLRHDAAEAILAGLVGAIEGIRESGDALRIRAWHGEAGGSIVLAQRQAAC